MEERLTRVCHNVKKQIIRGENDDKWDRPREGAVCVVFMSNVVVQDSSYYRDSVYFDPNVEMKDLDIVVGEGDCEIDRALDRLLVSMTIHEECKAYFSVENECEIVVFLRLIEIRNNPQFAFEWGDENKIVSAHKCKMYGTYLYRKQRVADAFYRYSKGLKMLILIEEPSRRSDDIYIVLCNNMALCQMHFKNYQYVTDLCDKVLKKDACNKKSLLRRMEAFVQLKNFQKARRDAVKILFHDPTNAFVKRKLKVIEETLKQQEAQYVKMVKQMFVRDEQQQQQQQ